MSYSAMTLGQLVLEALPEVDRLMLTRPAVGRYYLVCVSARVLDSRWLGET